jgi:hypothetical protein
MTSTPAARRNPDPQPDPVELLLLDTTPWLSCDECFERMDTYAEALLADPGHVDEAMARHLKGCAACDEEAQTLIDLLATGMA